MNYSNYIKEFNYIIQIGINNKFSVETLIKIYLNKVNKIYIQKYSSLSHYNDKPQTYTTIPYLSSISTTITHIFRSIQQKIIFTPTLSLKQIITHKIDKINILSKSGIYKLTCECNSFYIGRSIRSIKNRFKEHQNYITKSTTGKSAFSDHILETAHVYNTIPTNIYSLTKIKIIDELEQYYITLHNHTGLLLNNISTFENNLTQFLNKHQNHKP